jgi:hypothetical protein
MSMSIILLRGFSHSGKDYVGRILCEIHNYKRYAFADSLKKLVATEFGCEVEQLHSQEGKLQVCHNDKQKRTFRQILIDEALRLRNIEPSIFAKECCKDIYGVNPEEVPDNIVITDWRYPNEIEIVKNMFPSHKVIPILVKRVGQDKSPINDISEYQLINRESDYIINNLMNKTIYDEIKNLVNIIKILNYN